MKKWIVTFLIIMLFVSLQSLSKKPDEVKEIRTIPSFTGMSEFYQPTDLQFKDQIPSYPLPLPLEKIENYQKLSKMINLPEKAIKKFSGNGFIVLDDGYHHTDIVDFYNNIKQKDIPVFITASSLLHMYHIQFDETLRQVEEKEFYPRLWSISKALFDHSYKSYQSSKGTRKEAFKRNAAYFAVAMELLKVKPEQVQQTVQRHGMVQDENFSKEEMEKYQYTIPSDISQIVNEELALIQGKAGFKASPIFVYSEDYSQYQPRGHYNRSEKLKNYFLAMMWYGRMSMLLKGTDQVKQGETCQEIPPCTALISKEDAKIQTLGALEISTFMQNHENYLKDWGVIYDITSFYVGVSDDLGPREYSNMALTLGKYYNQFDDKTMNKVKTLAVQFDNPKIYGGTGNAGITPPFDPDELENLLAFTKGFRFMGQRFVPDSYFFQNLVFPKVDKFQGKGNPFTKVPSAVGATRGFPRGLDIMALLGSERASYWLKTLDDDKYERYYEQFASLQKEIAEFDQKTWHKNLYWSWLYSLKILLDAPTKGYPTFMQTKAWQDKTMNTALASWAQLRHDTILYAKQSYTPKRITSAGPGAGMKPVVGYVEPVPRFYHELKTLTDLTYNGLTDFGVLDASGKYRLESLSKILYELTRISIKELENNELEKREYDFIKTFGDQLNHVIESVPKKSKKTLSIADVHTDGNTNLVLEEGVGMINTIIVAYRLPDGRILAGAGPEFSYYEFKHPMKDRLTDEKWEKMLQDNPPAYPKWFHQYGVK